jgi:hypothetical protein
LTEHIGRASDPALLQVIETEPLVAVLVEYMDGRGRLEQRANPLFDDLRDFASKKGLLTIGRRRFPGGSQVLSRKLAVLKDVLALLGIAVDIRRSNGSIITLTRRSDGSDGQPSAEPSAPNPLPEEDLPPKDDKQERINRLRSKLDR